ncbi:hypothetical protein [Methylobacterium nigriterrae]|uniref:hypothetical protein n=1 Tax=Methylobacterium nigriterrae TaxID=3127512 RepID=UPI0030133F2E
MSVGFVAATCFSRLEPDRAIAEPSCELRTIQAKARRCLAEMEDTGEFLEPNPGVRLAAVILREIIALGA